MMRANSDQYSTPHLKPPFFFLRVILGADNGLLCTAPTHGMRNRAGREAAAAVAFSQCVCSSDRQTLGAFFIFFPPHLTCHMVQQGAAQPGEVGTAREAHGQSATISRSVSAHGRCVFIRVRRGSEGPGQHL